MSKRVGFGLGVSAGLLAVGMMFLLRYAAGVPTVPELVQDSLVQLFPGHVSSLIIGKLQKTAKLLLFAGAILALLGLLGLFGVLSVGRSSPSPGQISPGDAATDWLRRPWAFSVTWALIWWVLVVTVLFPNAGLGFSGNKTNSGAVVTALAVLGPPLTFVLALMFGKELVATFRRHAQPQMEAPRQVGIERRRFLGLSLAAVVGAITGSGLLKLFLSGEDFPGAPLATSPADVRWNVPPTPTPTVIGHPGTPGVPASEIPAGSVTPSRTPPPPGYVGPDTVPGLRSEVTSNEDFYVASMNVLDPVVSVSRWRLKIEGMVEGPIQLTYDELRALPSISQFTTLICISNPVGGPLISNAKWTGVRLSDLLRRARLKAGVKDIALYAADGYSDSIPVEKALEPATLVAYAMNDEPLPSSHGAPARLVVPGIYGKKNVKWLTGIGATDEDFKGFWERRGWSDIAVIKTMSRIDVPTSNQTISGRNVVGGIAFAGDRGVYEVEWSSDGGTSWQKAIVKPSISPFSWVLWRDQWDPEERGRLRLRVRAIDTEGTVQVGEVAEPFPDGASGFDEVSVRVV